MTDKKFFPSRKLGQNFLSDPGILKKVCDAGDLGSNDHVIEVGPGYGSLTKMLCSRAGYVTAVETDYRLFEYLSDQLSEIRNLRLVRGDILETGFNTFYSGRKIKLIANLPYNISSQILISLVEERGILENAVIMLQKEVADRILSEPGTKNYGSLSVIIQTYFRVNRVIKVPAGAFRPRPKIESTVIRLVPLEEPAAEITDHNLYRSVVRTAFSKRRKIIKNCLSPVFREEDIVAALDSAGIPATIRAESLGIEDFARLSNQFYLLQQSTRTSSKSF